MTAIWSAEISEDPLAFVNFVFPWGKEGTPLQNFSGPRKWQVEELTRITKHIKENKERLARGETPVVYQSATSSGRGVGKSALTAWLNLWMMSCVLGSSSITTANTETQLKSRTWAELGKWHTLLINSHWFDRTTLSLRPAPWFEDALKTQLKIDTGYYYSQAQLWSEENPDAFAGVHNQEGVLVIFDEASGIPKPIWTVSEGFFTEPILHRYWFCFSNPRRNTGEFYECFHKSRDYWYRRNLDSRTVEGTDVGKLNQIIEKHGADSDEARIEVKGEFPKQGDRQFIAREIVDGAVGRDLEVDHHAGLIMGVDIARYGDDTTVIAFRRGRDARSIPMVKLKGKDNMEVANECAFWIDQEKPDAVCIDAGNGTGVIDRLREMGYKVNEIWFGSKAEGEEWADLRTEMWAKMRDWLSGGCIASDQDLIDDILGPEYGFDKLERIKLEAKEKMKKRGIASPDAGDALAVTFAVKVARTDLVSSRRARGSRQVSGTDYDIFGG
ncbi:MAG: terminase [Candidatus Saccharibacteria bacterium]|nr:terminase [Candidatus Saccharibacteria bacterium]